MERWCLWHGRNGRALRLIQRTVTAVKAKADGKTASASSAAKLTKAMVALETQVSGLADPIIDYATARVGDEPFSTSRTEGAVQWLLHRRMGAQQQMRWSSHGAHLMLQVQTAIPAGRGMGCARIIVDNLYISVIMERWRNMKSWPR
jgi:hypothetical protein